MGSVEQPGTAGWWARGLIFENCTCQLVCPGHVHFDQLCTYERCAGFWAIRFDEGEYGGVRLDGARAVIAYETPQHMIDGNWTEAIIVDVSDAPGARPAVEAILSGRAGGPWAVLARFVGRWLETRELAIVLVEEGKTKRAAIDGLFAGQITEIRGRDRNKPVMFENMFNQIHPPEQVLARGDTRYDDGVMVIDNRNSHGLYSHFDWAVTAP